MNFKMPVVCYLQITVMRCKTFERLHIKFDKMLFSDVRSSGGGRVRAKVGWAGWRDLRGYYDYKFYTS